MGNYLARSKTQGFILWRDPLPSSLSPNQGALGKLPLLFRLTTSLSDQHVQNTPVPDNSTMSSVSVQSTSPCSVDINTAPVSPSPATSDISDVPPDMDSSQS